MRRWLCRWFMLHKYEVHYVTENDWALRCKHCGRLMGIDI